MRQPRTEPPWSTDGRAAALRAFDRSDDHADLAPLTLEDLPPQRVSRAHHGSVLHHLRFDLDDLSLVLKVLSDGDLRTVAGLLVGECGHARLRVRRPNGAHGTRIEADGSFRAFGLASGPLSLAILRQDRAPVVTEWFTV